MYAGVLTVRTNARRTAVCGMFAALAVVLLTAGSIFPLATFCAPALAGLCAVPVAVEFGIKAGLAVYIITGVLALFLCPDLEAVFIFLFLLGYYPLIKPWLDRIARPVLRVIAKLAVCNVSVLTCYGLLLFVFPLPALQQEMGGMGTVAAGGMLLLANITFLVYDAALANLFRIYLCRIRPRLFPPGRR